MFKKWFKFPKYRVRQDRVWRGTYYAEVKKGFFQSWESCYREEYGNVKDAEENINHFHERYLQTLKPTYIKEYVPPTPLDQSPLVKAMK